MSTYATRYNVKEQGAKVSPAHEASDEFSRAAIANLLEEHRQALSADFKASISTLETKLDHVHTTVSDHAQKIVSLEANATLQDERLLTVEASCAMLTESNAKLLAKVSDLESRSRRNNIRVVGVPESVEGPRPTAFFADLLMEVFGKGVLDSPPECDRAHRTLSVKPKPGQRARPVIIRLHRYQVKERIICEARTRRGKLQYRGSPISIYFILGLRAGGCGTTPEVQGGDVGALQHGLQTCIAIPCQACHRDERWGEEEVFFGLRG